MIGKQSQRIEHDDNRRPFMDEHGEAEAGPAEQRCRNQQGNRTERDEQVLADDRSRRAAQADGKGKLAKIAGLAEIVAGAPNEKEKIRKSTIFMTRKFRKSRMYFRATV